MRYRRPSSVQSLCQRFQPSHDRCNNAPACHPVFETGRLLTLVQIRVSKNEYSATFERIVAGDLSLKLSHLRGQGHRCPEGSRGARSRQMRRFERIFCDCVAISRALHFVEIRSAKGSSWPPHTLRHRIRSEAPYLVHSSRSTSCAGPSSRNLRRLCGHWPAWF